MHDIKTIRDNPDAFDASLARRGLPAQSAAVLKIDAARREALQTLQDAQARRNTASKEIGAAMGRKDATLADKLKAEVAGLKDIIANGEEADRRRHRRRRSGHGLDRSLTVAGCASRFEPRPNHPAAFYEARALAGAARPAPRLPLRGGPLTRPSAALGLRPPGRAPGPS